MPCFCLQGDSATSQKPPSYASLIKDEVMKPDLRMTRRTVQELTTGTLLFKLGQEGTYKTYVNHYTAHNSALSKQQATEERQKKTTMSHKFSLTDASTFKWQGSIHGGRPMLLNMLRQTLLQLELNLPTMFMHSNWCLLRKPWMAAVTSSETPKDFARALTVLQCCMKPCMMLQVWNDSLGHTGLKKIPILQREEKKKLEKRERKEKEDEEERLRPFMIHVKYTLGLKHQVHKQKGEEYRAHGQYGWLWLSGTRSFAPCDAAKQGLRAGPYRLAVKYLDIRDGTNKIVLMEPKAFKYLSAKQDELDEKKKRLEEQKDGEDGPPKEDAEAKDEEKKDTASSPSDPSQVKLNMERERLEEALKNARLTKQVEPPELSSDVVDVSAGLSNPTRVMYPKVAKKTRVLDDFLQRRQQLKTLEEKRIELKIGKKAAAAPVKVEDKKGEADFVDVDDSSPSADKEAKSASTSTESSEQAKKASEVNTFVVMAKRQLWQMVSRLKNAKLPDPLAVSNTTPEVKVANGTQEADKKAGEGNADKPLDEGNSTKLADEGSADKPLDEGKSTKLADEGSADKPLDEGNSTKLADEGSVTKPAEAAELNKGVEDPSKVQQKEQSDDIDIKEETSESTNNQVSESSSSEDKTTSQSCETSKPTCYSYLCLEGKMTSGCYSPTCNRGKVIKVENEAEPMEVEEVAQANNKESEVEVKEDGEEKMDTSEPPKKDNETNSSQDNEVKAEEKVTTPAAEEEVKSDNSNKIPPIIAEAGELHTEVTNEAREMGLDVPKVEEGESAPAFATTVDEAVSKLQDLVKYLMTKKEEYDKYASIGMSTVTATTSTTVNGVLQSKTASTQATKGVSLLNNTEDKKEKGEKSDEENQVERVYSGTDTSAKLYLKRIQSVAESKKQAKIVKYPLAPHFYARTRQKRNVLLLSRHDLKHLARKYGTVVAEGFNYNSKNNQQVWPYPCPRPFFRTAWLFRTACMDSLQAAALQLRVLWACVRWDDMSTRPLSTDGKHYQSNESASTTTEILRHRHRGRFSEKTQYYKKTVTIPLDVPKNTVEVTPIRSGLRKRKRAESPQSSEPKVEEKWIPEEKLELWEIRAYRERLERERNAPVTRVRTGAAVREPQRYDPGAAEAAKKSSDSTYGRETIRVKVDESPAKSNSPTVVTRTPQVVGPAPAMVVRRVTHPDGSVSLVRTAVSSAAATPTRPIAPNSSSMAGMPGTRPVQPAMPPGPTKKVFISKDGKIIGAQVVPITTPQPQPKVAIPANPAMTVASPQIQPTAVNSTPSPAVAAGAPQQKVQIVRSSDGKIQVRGLLAGQQLMQMPDGKLQIVATPNAASPNVVSGGGGNLIAASNAVATPTTSKVPQIVAAAPTPVRPATPTVMAAPKVISAASPIAPQVAGSPRHVVAHLLAPGSQIPPGTTAFVQGGKTYCIPKAAAQLAIQQQQQPQQQQAPQAAAAPPPPPPKPTPPVVQQPPQPQQQQQQSPLASQQVIMNNSGKQMVEVKTLGANTVSFKGHQMIVSGPDVAQAQAIANQLSTGQARLATLGGKQASFLDMYDINTVYVTLFLNLFRSLSPLLRLLLSSNNSNKTSQQPLVPSSPRSQFQSTKWRQQPARSCRQRQRSPLPRQPQRHRSPPRPPRPPPLPPRPPSR